MATRTFKVWRGDANGGAFKQYDVQVDPGMVVLDVLHRIQAQQANDLALRWNCKAGKCGSCSMEINGKPKLACMTRMGDYPEGQVLTVQPLKAFPVIKDIVPDVSWNFRQKERIPGFKPGPRPADGGNAILGVERMHFERRQADHEARADEGVLLAAVAVTEHMADVLAEVAFDALPELLHAVDVFLVHPVLAVGVARARLELRDALVLCVVRGDVGHEVFRHRERLQRLDGDGLALAPWP